MEKKFGNYEIKKLRKFLASHLLMFVLVAVMVFASLWTGCAAVAPEIVKTDKDNHKTIVSVAKARMESVSCDVGLMDGLGFTSAIDFPLNDINGIRALLQNPGIGLAFVEIRKIAKDTKKPGTEEKYWNEGEYAICKVLGLEYRAAALSVVDILKMFPQIAPYLAIFGPK